MVAQQKRMYLPWLKGGFWKMKEFFEDAILEMVSFQTEDVITASGNDLPDQELDLQ